MSANILQFLLSIGCTEHIQFEIKFNELLQRIFFFMCYKYSICKKINYKN